MALSAQDIDVVGGAIPTWPRECFKIELMNRIESLRDFLSNSRSLIIHAGSAQDTARAKVLKPGPTRIAERPLIGSSGPPVWMRMPPRPFDRPLRVCR